MASRFQRQRIQPMWNGGLRPGKIRDTMTQYLAERPEFARQLQEILEEGRAQGWEPMSMEGVRQPFDYAPRFTRRIH
jgi:hypothetical protein